MSALNAWLDEQREARQAAGLWREVQPIESRDGVIVTRRGKQLISFCDNDYFGLAQHPEVKQAAADAALEYGAGATSSRLITGTHTLYEELEAKLAEKKGTEGALVFGSGYLANVGIIPAIVSKGDIVIADRLIHACLHDGIKLSGARLYTYEHNDMGSLKSRLKRIRKEYNKCLIVTETVFSMDGDIAPLKTIAVLAEQFNAITLSDDAHGLGLVDANPNIDIQMGTLSKAAGSYGGYVCGSQALIDHLKNYAKSVIYTTALPPSCIAASIKSLDLLKNKDQLDKAITFTKKLGLEEAQSAIVPIVIGSAEDAVAASKKLEAEGYLVSAIRPPTVPKDTARLRFSFSSLHTDEQVHGLVDAIKRLKIWPR